MGNSVHCTVLSAKSAVDGHGWHPGTYFQSITVSHSLGLDGVHCGQLIVWKISKIGATRC